MTYIFFLADGRRMRVVAPYPNLSVEQVAAYAGILAHQVVEVRRAA